MEKYNNAFFEEYSSRDAMEFNHQSLRKIFSLLRNASFIIRNLFCDNFLPALSFIFFRENSEGFSNKIRSGIRYQRQGGIDGYLWCAANPNTRRKWRTLSQIPITEWVDRWFYYPRNTVNSDVSFYKERRIDIVNEPESQLGRVAFIPKLPAKCLMMLENREIRQSAGSNSPAEGWMKKCCFLVLTVWIAFVFDVTLVSKFCVETLVLIRIGNTAESAKIVTVETSWR